MRNLKMRVNPIIFFLVMSFMTAISFIAVAAQTPDSQIDKTYQMPKWCPPESNPALAVICGTVVTAGYAKSTGALEQAQVPIGDVLVAAYEEQFDSSTGKMYGKLTRPFTSTTTNKLGQYRLVIRRVGPPDVRVHVIYTCDGSDVKEHYEYDTWHNTYGIVTSVDCKPNLTRKSTLDLTKPLSPPFPLDYVNRGFFLGCTNNPLEDVAIGLAKKDAPVINDIVEEQNFDHRFTLNEVGLIVGPFGFTAFRSPGGLWEPDCLLRNKIGEYLCNATSKGTSAEWIQSFMTPNNEKITQPCVNSSENRITCDSNEDYKINGGYQPIQLYARADCTQNTGSLNADGTMTAEGQAAYEACKADQNKNPPQSSFDVDGTLYDGSKPMSTGDNVDYITRPFFKYVPKSEAEYVQPFRRLENRNNLQQLNMQPLSAMQWINSFIGSSANNMTGGPIVQLRQFMGPDSTLPGIPSCDVLQKDPGVGINQTGHNSQVNGGLITALASPVALEKFYYSGQRNLADPVCLDAKQQPVKLCEIQVPWGTSSHCAIGDSNCKDPDLKSKLSDSLTRLKSATSLIDPDSAKPIETNITETIKNCGSPYKLKSSYFPADLIFKTGNTQTGFKSEVINDSIGGDSDRASSFEPLNNEQQSEARTGSRVINQEGGNFKANSYNTILCVLNPQWCLNDPNTKYDPAAAINKPNVLTEDQIQEAYTDKSNWMINNLGPGQVGQCSISNTFQQIITSALDEALPSGSTDPDVPVGGHFDNLFRGNSQHPTNWVASTSTWYLSDQAILRDEKLSGKCSLGSVIKDTLGGFGTFVGTNELAMNLIFTNLCGREIWDSVLTLAGGDAKLHGLNFDLTKIVQATVSAIALSGNATWKSYGNRIDNPPQGTPLPKPYYPVKFPYPVTEATVLNSFRLPDPSNNKLISAGDWGPGQECYNFDTKVPAGQICGTYREPPYGISRTCRLDKCTNYFRKESATCTCTGPTGECTVTNRDERNLFTSECSSDNQVWCAVRQETTRTTTFPGNDYTCYSLNPDTGRTDQVNCDTLKPAEDADGNTNLRDDHSDTYDPPHIDADKVCNVQAFNWNNWDGLEKSKTIWGDPKGRPTCEATVAGPFRGNPNFAAAGTTPNVISAEQIKNCNGIVTVDDSGVRMSQGAPLSNKDQQNLDKAALLGDVVNQTFAAPSQEVSYGTKINTLDSEQSNDTHTDIYTRGKETAGIGSGNNDTFRSRLTNPVYIDATPEERTLHPVWFHCNTSGYVPGTDDKTEEVQKEKVNILKSTDPYLAALTGWACPIITTPRPQIADVSASGGQCVTTNWASCEAVIKNKIAPYAINAADKKLVTGFHFSDKFKGALNKAGQATDVPAAALLAVLSIESGFMSGDISQASDLLKAFGSDAVMDKWGAESWFGQIGGRYGGKRATCDNLQWSASGPYQLIQHWTQVILNSTDPTLGHDPFCAAVDSAGQGRCATVLTAGQCNFLTSSMIAGWLLKPGSTSCSNFNIDAALVANSAGIYTGDDIAIAKEIYAACGGH